MQLCRVCQHPELADINQLLREGWSLRGIGREFSLSKDSLSRHRNQHLNRTALPPAPAPPLQDGPLPYLEEKPEVGEPRQALREHEKKQAPEPPRKWLAARVVRDCYGGR